MIDGYHFSDWDDYSIKRIDRSDILKFLDKGTENGWNWGMHNAARGGHIDIVNLFVDKGTQNGYHFSNYEWGWGMRYAAQGGHMDMVKLLIDKGTQNGYQFSKHNWNLGMSTAEEYGHMNIVKFFIDKGADPCYLSSTTKEEINKLYKLENDLFKKILEKHTGNNYLAEYIGNEFYKIF